MPFAACRPGRLGVWSRYSSHHWIRRIITDFYFCSSAAMSGPQVSGPVVEGGCPRCGKRVYMAERQVAIGKVTPLLTSYEYCMSKSLTKHLNTFKSNIILKSEIFRFHHQQMLTTKCSFWYTFGRRPKIEVCHFIFRTGISLASYARTVPRGWIPHHWMTKMGRFTVKVSKLLLQSYIVSNISFFASWVAHI